MESILVSSCLLGEAVRYDGGDKRCDHGILRRWLAEGRVVSMCPELAGGLPVPRLPAEIAGAAGGASVLLGIAKVVDSAGGDVSSAFVKGAEKVLERARSQGIRIAVLKEDSPSCGTNFTYDGTFTSAKVLGQGVTAALLRQGGIHVFSEAQLAEAEALLLQLEARKDT